MTNNNFNSFRKAIKSELQKLDSPNYLEVWAVFGKEIDSLSKVGIVSLGNDCHLTGEALEFRVRQILEKMGFEVEEGRPNLEDIVVKSDDLEPNKPLVIEVKSSKSPSPKRENLRQLDDWVFDLSGEDMARKEGLGGGFDFKAMAFGGMLSERHSHPTPHKGVMLFNGPVGLSFEERPTQWLGHNEEEFSIKRNFCIISFKCLLNWLDAYKKDETVKNVFWKLIHATAGVLPMPNDVARN